MTKHVEAPTTEGAEDSLDAQLKAAKARRKEIVRENAAALRAADATIARLDAAKRELRRKPGTSARVLTAERQAGKKNIGRLREAAARLGTASQAALGSESGVGTGSLTWAIRALVDRGELVDTGRRDGGSRVFEFVPAKPGRRVVKPGEAA